MKTPSGTYFEVSELKRRVFVVVGPNFVSPSLNGGGVGGGGLNFSLSLSLSCERTRLR